jgi:hypothetical protein
MFRNFCWEILARQQPEIGFEKPIFWLLGADFWLLGADFWLLGADFWLLEALWISD